MSDRRYVFCVPRAGFNDVLCQIECVWRYAENHGRIPVIDASHSSLGEAFSRYFSAEAKNVFLHPPEGLLRHFDRLKVYPSCLAGRVSGHARKSVYVGRFDAMADAETGRLLTFDMSRPYREDLLVHHACGGGDISAACLRRLRLVPDVALEIARSLAILGEDYDAVHIRNTDIGTDYLPFFRRIFPLVRGRKLLICSDDQACREAAGRFFVESRVLTVTDIPDSGGKALHTFPQDIHAKNLAMLTDLLALARARELFTTTITAGRGIMFKEGRLAGFSLLARNLHAQLEIVDGLFAGLPEDLLLPAPPRRKGIQRRRRSPQAA